MTLNLVAPRPALPAGTGQSKAVDFSRVDLSPLLRVNKTVHVYFVYSPGPPPPQTDVDHDLFVSRGGATVSISTTKTYTSTPQLATRVVRGLATALSLSFLQKALGEANAGLQSDCEWPYTDPEIGGIYEITWNGKNARRNRFAVHFERGLPGNFPPCSPAVSQLVSDIAQYELEVSMKPDSEVNESK